MTKFVTAISYGLIALLISGCAAQMHSVKIGMTREQVKTAVGRPQNVIEARKTVEGKIVEVWEYPGGMGKKKYWVYFVDGRVYSWHRAGEMWTPRPVVPRSIK